MRAYAPESVKKSTENQPYFIRLFESFFCCFFPALYPNGYFQYYTTMTPEQQLLHQKDKKHLLGFYHPP
ncbi:MAG: hypothetical protein ACP5N7_01915 [Candidatus Pacearchaeota archaeon]